METFIHETMLSDVSLCDELINYHTNNLEYKARGQTGSGVSNTKISTDVYVHAGVQNPIIFMYVKELFDAVNKYFKQREPSYNFTSRNIKRDKMSEAAQKDLLKKNVGGMAESMEEGAKKQFKTKKRRKRNTPISDFDKKPRPKPSQFKPTRFKNGGMASRRAGIAKRGFNNFKGIF